MRVSSVSHIALLIMAGWIGSAAAGTPSTTPPVAPLLQYSVHEGLNINEFVRQDKVATHLLLRSGAEPRIIIAFPAGNSGIGLWFARLPQHADWKVIGTPQPTTLTDGRGRKLYGVVTEAQIATPALTIGKAVLSSVRVLRDYQSLGTVPAQVDTAPAAHDQTIIWARDRVDGAAGYQLSVDVLDGSLQRDTQGVARIAAGADGRIRLRITGASGETPLTPLYGRELLNVHAANDMAARDALTFLSYREKFLAGSWRFDNYFGRDTLMSVRMLMPALSAEAVETGLRAVLARLSDQGEVAHEESIGEFAVLEHLRANGSSSDAPIYDYKMIDGNFMLAPVARDWLLDDARGLARAKDFLARDDGRFPGPAVRSGDALVGNLRLVLNSAEPFAREPVWSNLISIKHGETVGNWRDSGEGLGRGHYPYDVNAVLVPAALEAAGRFYRSGLLDPYLHAVDRALFARAESMARVWRARAPPLFDVRVPHAEARAAIANYAASLGVPAQPALSALDAQDARFHGVSIDASGKPVPIMNSDEGFALLFGEPSAQSLEMAAAPLLQPFPAGLMTDVGMLVANPVYSSNEVRARFSRNAYHGTVVWSWQQALTAAGLERQLRRADLPAPVRAHLQAAQARLWAAITATHAMNNSELWS
ncbi:MAG: hypothetical protein ACRES2_04790, partial [Steroidobacteraceae bacterium]